MKPAKFVQKANNYPSDMHLTIKYMEWRDAKSKNPDHCWGFGNSQQYLLSSNNKIEN